MAASSQDRAPPLPARSGTGDRLIYLLFLLLAVCMAVWAARWGWAGLLLSDYQMAMTRMLKQDVPPDPQRLAYLDQQLTRAQELHPMNGDISFERGRLGEWQAQQYPLWDKEARIYRRESVAHLREAIQKRPSWGMAWIHLANGMVLDRQPYRESMAALEKASVLAPLEAGAQERVIWLGLSQWRFLDKELRQTVRRMVENVLVTNPNIAIKAIVDFRVEKELGGLLEREDFQKPLQLYLKRREQRGRAGK